MVCRSALSCLSVMAYQTSGASETIFVNFFSRSSRATGPNTRVPTGSPASLISTAALSSNRMYVPSLRRRSFRMRTTTAFTTLPFFTWLHGVARLGLACFIVRVELLRDAHHPAVLRVLHQPLHFDHDRLFHLRAGYFAGEHGALAALRSRRALCFGCHYAFLSSCARRSVFTRARSFFASRNRFSASACPVESWNRSRKICSVKSLCCACNSSLPASRIFSIRRGIVKTLPREQ